MVSTRKRLEGRLSAWALTSAKRWFSRKTPEQAERIGARLGGWLFRLSAKHRERAMRNLRMAYPEMPEPERLALARKVFEHFGRVTADFLISSRRDLNDLEASMDVEGAENLDAALAQGKGALLITGHFGNWERMSAWVSHRGYKLSVITRDVRDPSLNAAVNALRSNAGTEVIPRGNAARPILEKLRKGEMVGILPDQNSDEVFVPFFGHPAGTVLGPGVIHERTGAPVVPCWCVWVGPGRYRMIVEEPLVAESGFEVKGEGMIRAINASLERIVRQYPEQWLWFHDRWRSARRKGLL